MNNEVVTETVGDGVIEIRLERPERMNALGVETCAALEQAVAEAADRRAHVALFRGSGRAFCAGADLKERQGMDLAARLAHNAAIRAAVEAIAHAPFVTIAVINGVAFGGGLELALSCDLRVAAAGTTLGLTEARVGTVPGAGGTQRLPRLVGLGRALQMMLTGEPVTSEHAHSIGLVNEVISPDELDVRARVLAATIAGLSAPALAVIKRLVYRGMDGPLAAGLRLEQAALSDVLGSPDYAEGLAAFLEKRPPRFRDA